MNPEFRRQLWLQFSPTRLIVLPALLLLGAASVFFSERDWDTAALAEALAGFSAVAFMLLVYGMGLHAAGASMLDELREHTWDQQRMSAMQPWEMTWGKLAGAGAYAWYGAALCALIFVPAALVKGLAGVGWYVGAAVQAGVMLHALLLAANLQLSKIDGRLAQRGGAWALLGLGLWIGIVLFNIDNAEPVIWWDWSFTEIRFFSFTMTILSACALVSAWRCMAESLAVRQYPWGWPTLALALTVFLGGFESEQRQHVALIGFSISAALTYTALCMEPQPRTVWQRVFARIGAGQWRAAWQQLPAWPCSFVLTLVFALWLFMQTGLPYAQEAGISLDDSRFDSIAAAPMAAALLMLRDCCIALFFSFNPRARRPLGAFLLTMLVLHALLPWLFFAVGGQEMLMAALPVAKSGPAGIAIAAVHAAIGLAALRWRWVSTRSRGAKD